MSALIGDIANASGKALWTYEDVFASRVSIGSAAKLDDLVTRLIDCFSFKTTLRQQWGELALEWGTICPIRHVASRSLQIFCSLKPAFDQRLLAQILTRLSDTVADANEEVQGFALEVIQTLRIIVSSLPKDKIIMFPQLFWSPVAILYSNLEHEFFYALNLLSEIIQKIDLNDPLCQKALLASMPGDWRPAFQGLQPLLLRGLTSATSEETTRQMLTRLYTITCDALVDGSRGRLLYSLLAALPYLLAHFENPEASPECVKMVEALLIACERHSQNTEFAKLFNLYLKRRCRTEADFLKRLFALMKEMCDKELVDPALAFLVDILDRGMPGYRRGVLAIMKHFVQMLDLRIASSEASWLQLLKSLYDLISSDLQKDALEIFETVAHLHGDSTNVTEMLVGGGGGASMSVALVASPSRSLRGWNGTELNATIVRANVGRVVNTCAGIELLRRTSIVFSSPAKTDSNQQLAPGIAVALNNSTSGDYEFKIPVNDASLNDLLATLNVGEPGIYDVEQLLSAVNASGERIPGVEGGGSTSSNRLKRLSASIFNLSQARRLSQNAHPHADEIRRSSSAPIYPEGADGFDDSEAALGSTVALNGVRDDMPESLRIRLHLNAPYNEVISSQSFQHFFVNDLAAALDLSPRLIEVLRVQRGPEQIGTDVLFCIHSVEKDEESDLSARILELFLMPESALYRGQVTSRISQSIKPRIAFGKSCACFQ